MPPDPHYYPALAMAACARVLAAGCRLPSQHLVGARAGDCADQSTARAQTRAAQGIRRAGESLALPGRLCRTHDLAHRSIGACLLRCVLLSQAALQEQESRLEDLCARAESHHHKVRHEPKTVFEKRTISFRPLLPHAIAASA